MYRPMPAFHVSQKTPLLFNREMILLLIPLIVRYGSGVLLGVASGVWCIPHVSVSSMLWLSFMMEGTEQVGLARPRRQVWSRQPRVRRVSSL